MQLDEIGGTQYHTVGDWGCGAGQCTRGSRVPGYAIIIVLGDENAARHSRLRRKACYAKDCASAWPTVAGVCLLAQEESMWHVRDLHLARTSTSISDYGRHFISVQPPAARPSQLRLRRRQKVKYAPWIIRIFLYCLPDSLSVSILHYTYSCLRNIHRGHKITESLLFLQ